MGVFYRRLLIDIGIITSIGIILALVGVVFGLAPVGLAGILILMLGIVGTLATLFWAYVEHVLWLSSSYREIKERFRKLLSPSE